MTEKIRLFERIESGRTAVRAGRIPGLRERRKTLKRLLILLVSHREAAYSVLADDLGRSRQAAIWSEMLPLIQTLKYLIRKLPSLASPRRLPVNWVNFPAREKIFPEPLGHVLIAASWDFPILLALEPVIGAYAAGNRVVVKLSGRAEKSVQFVRWLIEETFVGDEVVSVDNEASLEELLAYGFDWSSDYDNFVYSQNSYSNYIVKEGFPRISRDSIALPIIKVQYEIILSNIEEYKQ